MIVTNREILNSFFLNRNKEKFFFLVFKQEFTDYQNTLTTTCNLAD